MTTASTVETNPEKIIAIVLRPELDRPAKTGPYRFPTAKTGPKGVKSGEMAMDGTFLNAGPNFVTVGEYEQMRANPFWDSFVRRKVIEVVEQDPTSVATGTSADFSLEAGYSMIEVAADEEWLKRCLVKDDRKEIQKIATERIQELQDELAKE